jgi:uncharacterized protein (DUF2252 family)
MLSVAERIQQFNSHRVPEMTAIKHRLMAKDQFRFFRGTCHLFYEDLKRHNSLPPSPLTWICGDLHLENFGSYKGNNRMVYFDLNDFDEALLAPANWETVRMLTSIFTAFDALKIKRKEANRTGRLFLSCYSQTLRKEKACYIEPEIAQGILRTFLTNVATRKQKELLRDRTIDKKGRIALAIDNTRLFKISKSLRQDLMEFIQSWLASRKLLQPHRVLDVGFRLAGTGSVGMKRYLFLLQSEANPKKYFFLDMKQAGPSSVQPHLPFQQPAWESEAQRVIAIQYRMQNVSPALLSAAEFQGDSYALKEMQPMADKVDFNLIKDRPKDVEQVIHDMALMSASSQLRSSGHQGAAVADELIMFGINSNWQDSLLDYATKYADQVKQDYQSYAKEYKSGFFSRQ